MSFPLGVVVVAFHGSDDLAHCLRTLGTSYPVVVVDNSSDSNVLCVARAAGAEHVDTGGNRGFAAGVNIGVSHLPNDADVLLLNPDAAITDSDVRILQEAFKADQRLAAVSPALRGFDGVIQRAAWPFPTPARMWAEAFGLAARLAQRDDFVVGSVLLLRRQALDEVGAFDERFFLYAEETDWQRRSSKQGWTVRVIPDVVALHRGAGTSDDPTRREILFHAAAETYVRKWYGKRGWLSYRLAALVGAAIRSVVGPESRRCLARRRARLYFLGPRFEAGFDE